MKKIILFVLLSLPTFAQDFEAEIKQHREDYRAEFLKGASSPIKEEDLAFLRFYEPDETFKVIADFKKSKKHKTFQLMTSNNQPREYLEYGEAFFQINDKMCRLTIYQMINPILKTYSDYLFLPFKDITNGVETYGGGRYVDLRLKDIKNGKIEIDFNKCYNPYCAFSAGYSCPIPPRSNHLTVAIEAGEKIFAKEIEH